MSDATAAPIDPIATLRSRRFIGLLVLAAVIGLVVSLLAWGFLELVNRIQVALFTDLPSGLGFSSVPWWWPLPILVIAGPPAAWAQSRPGRGGHIPAEGLKMGATTPDMLIGVFVAALAALGLGIVLGPEAPLIALGSGFTVLLVKELKKDTPQQAMMILAAAGSFAAISMIFESPVVAAVLMIEAAGIGGAMLPLVLIPGLLAAGVGSLTFIGVRNWAGLNTSAYSLGTLQLPHFAAPTWADIAWSIGLALAAAAVVFVVRSIGLRVVPYAAAHAYIVLPCVGAVIALLAIAFAELTSHGTDQVLFSGQAALPGLVTTASTWSMGALGMLLLCKGVGWGLALGSFRGGPTFPAIYLGAAGGLLAAHLPGLSMTPAVAVGMAAMTSAMLRLPLSAIVVAMVLTQTAGPGSAPLIILGSVTAYLAVLALDRWMVSLDAPAGQDPPAVAPTPSTA